MRTLPRAFGVALAIVAGLPGEALAHAQLTSATPAVNGVATTSPTELDLHFSEGVNLAFTGAEVRGPDEAVLPTGEAALQPNDDTTLVVPLLGALAAGTYTVSWHALSADGHKTKGSYTFTVKP